MRFIFLMAAALFLSGCVSPQFQFLNEAENAAAQDHLSKMSDAELCHDYEKYGNYSDEYALAKTRLKKEYLHRKLTPQKCSPAYSLCVSYGIEENTEGFKNCLVETNNTLLLREELEKNRLIQMNYWNNCRTSGWCP